MEFFQHMKYTHRNTITIILKLLIVMSIINLGENKAHGNDMPTGSSVLSDKHDENRNKTLFSNWEKSATETLRLEDDSTFAWHAEVDYHANCGEHRAFGEGMYSRIGDTIVLNSHDKRELDIKINIEKKHNKNKRKIIIRELYKSKRLMDVALYVTYINENGDTVYTNNFSTPEIWWSMRSTPLVKIVELDHPTKIVDIMAEPLNLRPSDMKEINQHRGDIEITIDLGMPRYKRNFCNEKWIIKGDTVFPLTPDGYRSIYPLVKHDSMYVSIRKYYGKPYDGEYYDRKLPSGSYMGEFGNDLEDVQFNYKYQKQAIANGFKHYGIVTSKKCYDKDGNLVAEGEYLSDTNNPFFRWYKYIKVGRWKYYEPDGTIRYVDY